MVNKLFLKHRLLQCVPFQQSWMLQYPIITVRVKQHKEQTEYHCWFCSAVKSILATASLTFTTSGELPSPLASKPWILKCIDGQD